MVPRRVYLYIILAGGTPQNVPRLAPTFKLFLCSIRRIFLIVSSRTVIIINVGSSSAAVYFLLQEEYTSFWQTIPRRVYLYVTLANGTPQRVSLDSPQRSQYFLCPMERTFFVPLCSVIIFNGVPSSVNV